MCPTARLSIPIDDVINARIVVGFELGSEIGKGKHWFRGFNEKPASCALGLCGSWLPELWQLIGGHAITLQERVLGQLIGHWNARKQP